MYVTDLKNPLLYIPQLYTNLQHFTSINRMKFLYGILGFPLLSTLKRAILAGYLNSFPDLTEKNISKLKTSDITVLGRLDTTRKNLLSINPKQKDDE